MSLLIEKTLREIESRNIRPVSSWRIKLQNALYWIGTGTLLLCASIATALSLHSFLEIDWDAYAKAEFVWYESVLSGVPFFMIFLLLLFIGGAIVFLHHTRRGYRYSRSFLLSSFALISVVLGYGLEMTPLDEPVEEFFLGSLPQVDTLHAVVIPTVETQWSQPEKGLLGGEVLKNTEEEKLELKDSEKQNWSIDYSEAKVEKGVELKPNQKIKIIGEEQEKNVFKAKEIRVWQTEGRSKNKLEADEKKESIKHEQKKSDDDEEEEIETKDGDDDEEDSESRDEEDRDEKDDQEDD